MAACITSQVHAPADLLARFGGEESVVLLPRTELTGALAVAEVMHAPVVDLAAPHPRATRQIPTIGIGVTCMQPNHMSRSDELVTQADAALHQAKLNGRDCCRSASSSARRVKAA